MACETSLQVVYNCDGNATLTASPALGGTVHWSTGATGASITVSTIGTYSYEISGANCGPVVYLNSPLAITCMYGGECGSTKDYQSLLAGLKKMTANTCKLAKGNVYGIDDCGTWDKEILRYMAIKAFENDDVVQDDCDCCVPFTFTNNLPKKSKDCLIAVMNS